QVLLGRCMTPHVHVHRRSHHHRSRGRQVQRGKKILRQPVRKARKRRCRRWSHQQRINRLRHANVFHRGVQRRIGVALREHLGDHFFSGQRGKGQRTHKLLRRGGHHHLHPHSAILQPSCNLGCLVCGDATRNSQCNFHGSIFC